MATQAEIQAAMANEARRREIKNRISSLQGQMTASSQLIKAATSMIQDAERSLSDAQAEQAVLDTGGGQGITDDFGEYSTLEQAMQQERYAGKSAAIDYIKTNPTCTESEAQIIYEQAALAARPADRKWLLINSASLRQEYAANLVKYGYISDSTWESWRAWIIATDKDTIMGVN